MNFPNSPGEVPSKLPKPVGVFVPICFQIRLPFSLWTARSLYSPDLSPICSLNVVMNAGKKLSMVYNKDFGALLSTFFAWKHPPQYIFANPETRGSRPFAACTYVLMVCCSGCLPKSVRSFRQQHVCVRPFDMLSSLLVSSFYKIFRLF